MPYSAPENYTPQPHYDSKNDVFSLGVIMYELFFGKYPFYLHDEDLRRLVYSTGTYQEYWFEAPEEALPNGDPLVMPTLYSVMLQCLREDPRDRPELEWIALLFREFIEFLK
jgi:serine/threonine protein kinase